MEFQPEKTREKCKACGICGGKRNAKFCRKFVPIPPPPPTPPKATSSVQRKDNSKVFLEIGIDTVPSEMTARVLLKLIENFCNHFHMHVVTNVNTKELDFRKGDI